MLFLFEIDQGQFAERRKIRRHRFYDDTVMQRSLVKIALAPLKFAEQSTDSQIFGVGRHSFLQGLSRASKCAVLLQQDRRRKIRISNPPALTGRQFETGQLIGVALEISVSVTDHRHVNKLRRNRAGIGDWHRIKPLPIKGHSRLAKRLW